MTLAQWSAKFWHIIDDHVGGARCVHIDAGTPERQLLYDLEDYFVSSATASTVWLIPEDVVLKDE